MPVYGAPKQLAIWVKDNPGLGLFYRNQHELVFIFKLGQDPHISNFGQGERGGRYRTNVWRYPVVGGKPAVAEQSTVVHPTIKPVAMVADAIKDCSLRGGLILDPFGGSGTTLMAAERTGRRARIIELDPLYSDLIVRRWQRFTGNSAIHEASGRSFVELSGERTLRSVTDDR
jgi:DNA modification methylase